MKKLGKDKRSLMFPFVKKTWNPVIGCQHNCIYCWARRMAEGRLKHHPKYRDGFKPKFFQDELNVKFKDGDFVFVVDMGDLFGEWVPEEWIVKVIEKTYEFPNTTFLFLTKNPLRYHEFLDMFRDNHILGATIETNRDYKVTKAPPPEERYEAMKSLKGVRKFVSIEPIMDFDVDVFSRWILDIMPEFVCIGYDNWGNKLPEPPFEKVRDLIERINVFIRIYLKKLQYHTTLLKYI